MAENQKGIQAQAGWVCLFPSLQRRSYGDNEVAQKQGLPLGCKRMLWCSEGWSLGCIEVAQKRGLPLG